MDPLIAFGRHGRQGIPTARPRNGRLHRRVHGVGGRAARHAGRRAGLPARPHPQRGAAQGTKVGRNHERHRGQNHARCESFFDPLSIWLPSFVILRFPPVMDGVT